MDPQFELSQGGSGASWLNLFTTVATNNVFCCFFFFTKMVILLLATHTPREKQDQRTRMGLLSMLIFLKHAGENVFSINIGNIAERVKFMIAF